jgi:hypothetical protein
MGEWGNGECEDARGWVGNEKGGSQIRRRLLTRKRGVS